ncbi:hypothetical protein SAMN03159338_2190 [Sphingomonas sp. NFR04]|uniref:hypothetical protein n=1 Tax=Sphingomonas sp. NFR04 TaxID=1566283 RepID=UPI0008F0CE2D|nr:hypothetical protein [Sphingomonas sp. NFR04]SFJ68967.1 hypothetical protein SAMN03159338_2190 [Sphingomonas sp. NFR04]
MRTCYLKLMVGVVLGTASVGALQAQDLPSDEQLQRAFGATYNRLGLIEYCVANGFATTGDVANARRIVAATLSGMTATPAARVQQEVGRRGTIVGPQVIGLMNPADPAHPEEVREGQTISLVENARAQKLSERTLCKQMTEQAAAVGAAER